MKTDITLLPVYNKMYELGLEEAAIEKIRTKIEDITDTNLIYNFTANNSYIKLSGYPTYHYGRVDRIELLPKDAAVDESKHILENLPCFSLLRPINGNVALCEDNLLKRTDVELKHIVNSMYLADAYIVNKTIAFSSVEEMKETLRGILVNRTIHSNGALHLLRATRDLAEVTGALAWIFDTKFNPSVVSSLRDKGSYIGQITNVAEAPNNIRLATSESTYDRRWQGQALDSYVIMANEEHPAYDYLDIHRQYYNDVMTTGEELGNKNDDRALPKVFLLNEKVKAPQNEDVFKSIHDRYLSQKVTLVDRDIMDSTIRRLQRKEALSNSEEEQKEKLKDKFLKKLDLLDDGKTFSLNGVTLTNDSIEYAGQAIKCDLVNIPTLLQRYGRYRSVDDLNFDVISKDFIESINNKFHYTGTNFTATAEVGDVSVNIENKVSDGKNGAYRNVYMNGFRVKKDEIGQIISRGLCFKKQDDYDAFIKQVSKCSLEMHSLLDDGIEIHVHDNYKNIKVNFKIPLVRRKNINYIVIDDKEYKVSNTAKIKKLATVNFVHDVINTLLDPGAVKISGPDDIAFIIKRGTELLKEAKNKNRELIENTEKILQVEETTITHNGIHYRGYLIEGNLRKYFLDIGNTDKETVFDRLRAFTYPDMGYTCMIEKTVNQTGPSSLISRMYALRNDSLVANDIETLNQPTI